MEQELIIKSVIQNVGIPDKFVRNTIELLQEGSTIHFIARYRKEKTNSLDEEQLRNIENKFEYYTELEKRKKTVLKSIKEQDKLTPELEKRIIECREKLKLEDIYLPYKPKRRTKATIAKEKGLEPLADIILVDQITEGVKESIIAGFINPEKKVYSSEDVIIGTLDIISEKLSEVVEVRGILREYTLNKGNIISKPQKEWVGKKSKYEDYYSLSEPIKKSPSHRILAIRRGAKEGVLSWKIEVEEVIAFSLIEELIVKNKKSIFFEELLIAVRQSYKKMLCPSIELEVFMLKLKEAELEAISVFSKNLRKLLLAPPAGHKNILGVDPGYRAGCKMAVIDSNGNFKDNDQMFPHPPQNKSSSAEKILVNLIKKYKIDLVAIGHGTASKETDVFVKEIVKKNRLDCKVVVVNEAGASVYSASATAKREFPDLDILVRGAISIARRLQDPLSELIKIDPKSIGVGQYQHDVNQAELKKNLGFVVESCVNHVGVDLNTASQDILSFISGVGNSTAKSIYQYRIEQGSFANKNELLKVPKLGEKVFQQCAGFLRIFNGNNPLDNSAIHPENYSLVENMARDQGFRIVDLIGNESLISKIKPEDYASEGLGLLTIEDILKELIKPGVDPRKDFVYIQHNSRINEIEDLEEEMILDGTVTNVTNFGAFVDIGVHHDGLIHISKLSDKFIKNSHDVVSVGDILKVQIISINKELKRIGLKRLINI